MVHLHGSPAQHNLVANLRMSLSENGAGKTWGLRQNQEHTRGEEDGVELPACVPIVHGHYRHHVRSSPRHTSILSGQVEKSMRAWNPRASFKWK
jgi:hypothetical protein